MRQLLLGRRLLSGGCRLLRRVGGERCRRRRLVAQEAVRVELLLAVDRKRGCVRQRVGEVAARLAFVVRSDRNGHRRAHHSNWNGSWGVVQRHVRSARAGCVQLARERSGVLACGACVRRKACERAARPLRAHNAHA